MKKTIAILLVLVIGMAGVWADASSGLPGSTDESVINLTTTVAQFALFGLSENAVAEANFATKALFEEAVSTSIDKAIDMLSLANPLEVGKLSGINNTDVPVSLTISTTPLTSGSNTIALKVIDGSATISASASSAFGVLKNKAIMVQEDVPGAAALAPAGNYTATVTIQLTT